MNKNLLKQIAAEA